MSDPFTSNPSDEECRDVMGATLALISELRGGVPPSCDFCGAPLDDQNEPVPEEGDLWAGLNCCWLRWEAEDVARGPKP